MKKDRRSNNLTTKQFKRRYRTKSHIRITKLLHPIISAFNMRNHPYVKMRQIVGQLIISQRYTKFFI